MSKKNNSISAKGYYIALILCAVAIGITGYLYYRNADDQPDDLANQPTGAVSSTLDDHVQAVATQPTVGSTEGTQPVQTTPPKGKPFKTSVPLEGQTVMEFAMDRLCFNQTTRDWRTHNGVDIAAAAGTPVCAAADGQVYTVYEDETMGMTVVLQHADGYMTKYASLADEVAVAAGDSVTAGQTIGHVGNTALLETAIGDHLHFSVTCNDMPVDPANFLGQE